jgi:hypothetical protein
MESSAEVTVTPFDKVVSAEAIAAGERAGGWAESVRVWRRVSCGPRGREGRTGDEGGGRERAESRELGKAGR